MLFLFRKGNEPLRNGAFPLIACTCLGPVSCYSPKNICFPYKYSRVAGATSFFNHISPRFSILMHFTHLINLLLLALCAVAVPVKRLYRPSSAVFSVIAHHEGAVFQYNLLKYNGKELVLNADEKAFFGRVRASEGYVLNLPGSVKSDNGTQLIANTTNVHVNPTTYQLTTTSGANNATHGFGITNQKLTFRNSTGFLACPENSYRGEYLVFWGNNNQTVCPNKARGYTIELIVETDATINYNPSTNNQTIPAITYTNLSTSSTTSSSKTKRWFFF